MATQVSAVLEKDTTPKQGTPLTWVISLIACAYCLWMGVALFYSTHAFTDLYSNIGAELPLSTRIAVGFYRVLYPIVFGGAAALVMVKQYFVREKWANISASLGTV
ncbi:MAG TPA: hypothetical protein VFP71_15160, partial [Candidatus Angelobacter sp.]|nr:hypothetical protein [Candidatus Angelobacter sp.]